MGYQVTFPNQQIITLPPETAAAIAASKAKYAEPLWHFRAERVLKLGRHQWIFPGDLAAAYALYGAHPGGIIATAWKLFNRSWRGAAEEYFCDHTRYPKHPRHLGENVVPLVDEDNDAQQIGWVRINQVTQADENYAVFVQFTLLELFAARTLPTAYL